MERTDWPDRIWSKLVSRINQHQMTPVLGAGASIGIFGSAARIAREWAGQINYPFPDDDSLSAVAQFVATTEDRASAGEFIQDMMRSRLESFAPADKIPDPHDVYRYLPSLDFPIWITTNYDDLIERGLRAHNKSPACGMSAWTPPDIVWDASEYDVEDAEPNVQDPLVFHLHGKYTEDASMVITEADYLEFLEQMAADAEVLPTVVNDALATTSLLFIGYGFGDVNLQLLLRAWNLQRRAYAVQPLPDGLSDEQAGAWIDYYPKYLEAVTGARVTMFWGTASEFCTALDSYLARSDD